MHRAGNGDALHLVNVAQAPEGDEFHAPGPGDFEFPPLFGEGTFFTKPMLVVVLGALLVGVVFYLASRRAAMVPAKMQFVGESIYGFVRNDIVGDTIGREGRKFVPYLTTLFCFIAVLNVVGHPPGAPVPRHRQDRLPAGARAHLVGDLQLRRHQEARLLRLLQGDDVPARPAEADLRAAGAAGVPLDGHHPADHAHPPSHAEHVRRAPRAPADRARRRVPPASRRAAASRCSASCRSRSRSS